MDTLYNANGLIFWTEEEIKTRKLVEEFLLMRLIHCLKTMNRAFEFVQVEAPILTPRSFINPQYTDEDMFVLPDDLVLRPETTMGSFVALKELLDPYRERKFKLPLVVWQHGKSFRREQDQVWKHMRLKEFYQMEFQIAYSIETKNDYTPKVINAVRDAISKLIGPCHVEPSDRLPSYSECTTDIICQKNGMEVCSISKRTDFEPAAILEVAIGTDRINYCFNHQDVYL